MTINSIPLPPTRKRKNKKSPPPPPRAKRKAKAKKEATSHVNRVTLNLLRHSKCCPTPLRVVIQQLADKEWQMAALSRAEREMIYAMVDGPIADKARSEFNARTDSIRDHRKYVTCSLCGHYPIRFEFDLENNAGGKGIKTGSVCICTYGISVDGEAVAEKALALLQKACVGKKREADRADWQEEHPDHKEDIDYLREVLVMLTRYKRPHHLWPFMEPKWKARVIEAINAAGGAIRYYDKWEYLLEPRTDSLYGENGLLDSPLIDELNIAIKQHKAAKVNWTKFLKKADKLMNPYEASIVEAIRNRGLPYDLLNDYEKDVVTEIRNRLTGAH